MRYVQGAILIWFIAIFAGAIALRNSIHPAMNRRPTPAKSIARPLDLPPAPALSTGEILNPAPDTAERAQVSAPTDQFSEDQVLAEREYAPDADGHQLRVKLLATDFKYPFVRVEETFMRNSDTGEQEMTDRVAMVADHFILKLRPEATEYDLQMLSARLGTGTAEATQAPGTYIVKLPGNDMDGVPRIVDALSRETDVVDFAEPDFIVTIAATPNDALFARQGNLNRNSPIGTIRATSAWDRNIGSSKVKVGVIDTGIDYKHEDLAGNIWNNPNEIPGNGIDDDKDGYVDDVVGWNFYARNNNPMDDHFHGTHVAGTIGAVGNNGKGVTGVCWKVSLVALKFMNGKGQGAVSDAAAAIDYATRLRLDVTNNSWEFTSRSKVLEEAILRSQHAGIPFVTAAGNGTVGSSIDGKSIYPAAFNFANMIVVTATTDQDALAAFANYGKKTVHIAAPGVAIFSTLPSSPTPAMVKQGILMRYGAMSGTSTAVPQVTGVCALLKSAMPELTYVDIKKRILESATPIKALKDKTVSGGLLNADTATTGGKK